MKKILLLSILPLILFANIASITYIKGDVKIQRKNNTIKAKNSMKIYNHDIIFTSKKSKVRLKFKDNTIVRIGQNSHLTIDDYLYDKTKKSKTSFIVRNGFFKVVTGKIAKISRENFTLRTRTATCGVRGTTFSGFVSPFGDTIACTSGAIDVTSSDVTVPLYAGQVTYIKDGEAPRVPRKLQKGELKTMETKNIVIQNSSIINRSSISDSTLRGNSGISIKADNIKIEDSTIQNSTKIDKSNVDGNSGTNINAKEINIKGSTMYNYSNTNSSNIKGNSGISIGDDYISPNKIEDKR
jgi:hypothetical protein